MQGGCPDIIEESFILAECVAEAFYSNIVLLKSVIIVNLVFTKKKIKSPFNSTLHSIKIYF